MNKIFSTFFTFLYFICFVRSFFPLFLSSYYFRLFDIKFELSHKLAQSKSETSGNNGSGKIYFFLSYFLYFDVTEIDVHDIIMHLMRTSTKQSEEQEA